MHASELKRQRAGRRQEQRLEKNPRYYARTPQPRFRDPAYADPDYTDTQGRLYVYSRTTESDGSRTRLWVKLPNRETPWFNHGPGGSRHLALLPLKKDLPDLSACLILIAQMEPRGFRTGFIVVKPV